MIKLFLNGVKHKIQRIGSREWYANINYAKADLKMRLLQMNSKWRNFHSRFFVLEEVEYTDLVQFCKT